MGNATLKGGVLPAVLLGAANWGNVMDGLQWGAC